MHIARRIAPRTLAVQSRATHHSALRERTLQSGLLTVVTTDTPKSTVTSVAMGEWTAALDCPEHRTFPVPLVQLMHGEANRVGPHLKCTCLVLAVNSCGICRCTYV